MLKTKREYEISVDLDISVSRAAVRAGKRSSQVVEDILRKDPLIAELIEEHRDMRPMPDYDPRSHEKIRA